MKIKQIWKYVKTPIRYNYVNTSIKGSKRNKDHLIGVLWFFFIIYAHRDWKKPEKTDSGFDAGKLIVTNLIKEFPDVR